MRKPLLGAFGIASTIVVAILLVELVSSNPSGLPGSEGSGPGVTETKGPPRKTAWGEPDLQGIWTDNYAIPLQRPSRYAGKEYFTEQEQAELDRKRAAAPRQNDNGIARRGTEQDVSGAYNSVFTSMKHTGRRTSLITDPPDGRIPPVTPQVEQRRADFRSFQLALLQATDVCRQKLAGCAGGQYGPVSPRRSEVPPSYIATGGIGGGAINRSDGPEDRSLAERCMSATLPDFGGFRRIVQSPGSVSIFYDTGQGQGWSRVIPIATIAHLPSHIRLWWGDSRGHWEGDTLVVDVTNFSSKTDFQGSRENLHLAERWRRLDTETLEYIVTIEDATTWTRSWTVKQELAKQSDRHNRIYHEPRCHEGNFGMVGLLAGARAEEKAFAQGRGPNPATRCTAGCGTGIEEVEDPEGVRDGAIGQAR
jgi:hypothetical protein